MRVAVIGCGMSPVGASLGSEIDGHDLVIRANRAFMTSGKENDWGRRTDILCIGNLPALAMYLPSPAPFEVIDIQATWHGIWEHKQKPLAGTFAALHAARLGATSITLYGLDLYHGYIGKIDRNQRPTVFHGHVGLPPNQYWKPDLDRDALERLPCPVTWRLRQS